MLLPVCRLHHFCDAGPRGLAQQGEHALLLGDALDLWLVNFHRCFGGGDSLGLCYLMSISEEPFSMSALSSMSGLSRTTAMRVASLITAINVLVAVGFSVAGLVNPKWILSADYVPTEASFIFALYAAARTIPLAVIALVAIYQRSESAILLLGTLAGFIQLLDAGVGLLQHDLGKSIGPLVIAAFQLLAVCLLRGSVRGGVE